MFHPPQRCLERWDIPHLNPQLRRSGGCRAPSVGNALKMNSPDPENSILHRVPRDVPTCIANHGTGLAPSVGSLVRVASEFLPTL